MNILIPGALLALLAFAGDAEDQPPTPKQAVLKAVELAEGKGLYRSSLEVAVSETDQGVTVVFRRPTSHIIEAEGRLPTKRIWKASFQGKQVKTEPLDDGVARPKFDREYSRKRDREAARAVAIAISHLWKGQELGTKEFKVKEFAVEVSAGEGCDIVEISHIPYKPDAFTTIYVYPDGRVEIFGGP